VVIEDGVDALAPQCPLVDEGLVEPDALSPLEDLFGWDPALGEFPCVEELPQQLGVAAVGLGLVLASSRCLGVGRLGEERREAHCRNSWTT
jgi:hypothetical protein